MLILAIDSCASSCGVGVWFDGRWLSRLHEDMERGQDARLIPMIVDAMKAAQREFSDLDRVAVMRGPGSFTGVRVCLSAARGIGLASGKPVIGVDRFSIYNALHGGEGDVLVAIESKRLEKFCKFFPEDGASHDATMMTQEEIAEFLRKHSETKIVGDMLGAEGDALAVCAELAVKAFLEDSEFMPRPLYIRPPDVTVKKI